MYTILVYCNCRTDIYFKWNTDTNLTLVFHKKLPVFQNNLKNLTNQKWKNSTA